MERRRVALKRGNIVLVAEGKPRPSVIIQSDRVLTPGTVIICPLTSVLIDAPIYRRTILPRPSNGLRVTSQIMADRISLARASRIDKVIGTLEADELELLDQTLITLLDLGG